ncbi:MAG: hypothetical protein K9M57_04925 [Phycisphaerae bacterium]|nr:hypothetical protein [Phycisphaerae bacterium]
MGKNESKDHKKRIKKRQKDKARRKKQAGAVPFALLSPKKKVLICRDFPIHECLINPSWKEKGLANITISRQQPDGNLVVGVYLVDTFCMGLKNTFFISDFSLSKYKDELVHKAYYQENPVKCPISLACHIIYDGIAFADQFGFKPNKDFKYSQYLLDEKNDLDPIEPIEFGKDGKPLFISGPDDDANAITQQLSIKVGNENFHYVCSMP